MSVSANSFVHAWPPFMASKPVVLRSMLVGLNESQYWTAADVASGQQAQLMRLAEWAAKRVPYYKDGRRIAKSLGALKHASGSFWDAWQSVPLLTKAALRSQGRHMDANKVPASDLPLGRSITSGSTGIPVEVKTTTLTRTIWEALTLREHLWQRRDFSKRFGAIRYVSPPDRDPKGKSMATWGVPVAQLYRSGPASIIHVGYPVDVLADWLKAFDPHYLLTYPSVAAALMDELQAKPASLEELRLISEPVQPSLEARLSEEWGVRVSDIYSANEMGNVAFRCGEHGNLHVQPETVLVEVLSETGAHCAAGETGRLVITPLHNLATPLIRYELGDYATLGEPCPCGRGSTVIRQILGRVRNLVRTPDGRRYWPVLGKFRSIDAVRQFQFVQSALDRIEIRLVLERPLTGEEQTRIVELVRNALNFPFRVEIRPVQNIERGPTGKYEEFLSLLPP